MIKKKKLRKVKYIARSASLSSGLNNWAANLLVGRVNIGKGFVWSVKVRT